MDIPAAPRRNPGPVPLARPWTGEAEERLLLETLRSGRLVAGPRVAAFEEAVGRRLGARAAATSSGSTALLAALRALGFGAGDEAIVPAYTFAATASAVVLAGGAPVFADVDPETLCIPASEVERLATARTRVVVPVHQFGLPAPVAEIEAAAARRGLAVLVDAACALGTEAGGRPIGAEGAASILSFHPRKVLTTGEGGMALTRDQALAARLRAQIDHGLRRVGAERAPETVGGNFRMSELHAALGLAQMERLPEILALRRRLGARYREAFADLARARPLAVPAGVLPNEQTFCLRCPGPEARAALAEALAKAEIESAVPATALHLAPAFAPWAPPAEALPGARALHETLLAIPLFARMTEPEQDRVIDAVRRWDRG